MRGEKEGMQHQIQDMCAAICAVRGLGGGSDPVAISIVTLRELR